MKSIYTILALAVLLAMGIGKAHAQVVDVCAGNDIVELHLGNYQYGLVQWQVSDDNEFWMDIDGAIDTVYRFMPERPRYYRAEIRFPACMENNYYSQVSYVQMPPKAFAGPDMSIPAGTVARLCASSFKGAEGEWHIIEGENGLIEDASNPKSGFIGGEGEYKLTWTVTNSCGSNTDTVTVRCVRMEYQPNIVYVDETDAILSDSTQIVNGEYVIVFSDPVPDIQIGSVLLGYRKPSFLRKVVSFEREGDLYVMQTEQGMLTDVILSGALFIDPSSIAGDGGKKDMVRYIDHYPTRKEMSENPFLLRDGNIYILNNSVIGNRGEKGDDWEVTAEWDQDKHSLELGIMLNFGIWNDNLDGLIYEETVSLDPNLRVNIVHDDDGVLNECRLGLYDAVFEHTVSLSIDKEFSVSSIEAKGTINNSPILVGAALIGGVPVTLSLDFPAFCSLSAAINGLTVSFTSSTTFTNAIEYDPETHEFIKVHDKQPSVDEPGEFDINGTIDFKLNAGVKFSILIAGVLGPYVEWSGRVNPSICTSLTPPYYVNADLNYGLDMELGIRFHLFKDLLEADVSRNFKMIDRKEHAPSSVNKYLGDNQVYTFGSFLPTPITVDVEGWFGSKLPLAKIYFEPEIGGEVTNPVASTDIHGKASTLWRPNNPFGRDKLRVKAYDCHGDLIAGTPVVFHAYSSATDPCINSNLTVEAYHVQEDRIIPLVHGGESPFLYSTDGESFSSTVPNIQTQPGHNYTFYVQDKNGCEAMTTYNEPFYDCENSSLTLSVTASGNVINATAYFGFEPYWYSIDGINYQPTGFFTPLLDGEYTIYVRDALGCVDTKHITVSREGNLYVWISEIDGHSGTAEVRTSTSSLADRGICWSTHHAPTVEDLRVSYGNNTGPFPFTINGLDPETTYYVRAYALDLSGTSYSEERCINPGYGVYLPEVAATGITSVTQTSAVGSGNVTWDGGTEVTERGICLGTNHNPDISGDHIPCGSGIGAYTADITDLTPNMQYYARAYATNSEGTAYGDEVGFFTGDGGGNEIPEGVINGLFSVSEGQQVYFSQGNLQYQASTNTWRFAENQWDYIGGGNNNISQTYDGWIDLFGWGASGYDHGALCYQPWSTIENGNYWKVYGDYNFNLYDQTGQADWGYNAISNGGNTENIWRTLTQPEWEYVMFNRNTMSGMRFAKAVIEDINGVLLLPDNWDVSVFNLNDVNAINVNFNSNIISESQWNTLQNVGVVFLPITGIRHGTSTSNSNYGHYWSSSRYSSSSAYSLVFGKSYVGLTDYNRFDGHSVRLVYSTYGELPVVSTFEIMEFNYTSAKCKGEVVSNGGLLTVTERGVCWSTSPNPTINDNHVSAGGGMGLFSVNVIGLLQGTTYYVRSYATNMEGTAYGNEVSFTTLQEGSETHEYVDLGLPSGTLWATCNVGANTMEEYGDCFAWGETLPKEVYDWDTYQYCDGGYNRLTKYCNDSDYGYHGFIDNLTTLMPEDDAATANWGSEWCMPSMEQFEELYQNTTLTLTTQNGVNGTLFTAQNGNNLFLPLANSRYDFYEYWSSSLETGSGVSTIFACVLRYFIDNCFMAECERMEGRPVRPVRSSSPSGQLPQVTTMAVTEFTSSSATCGGNVMSEGGSPVTERGVCWSTDFIPTVDDGHASAGSGLGSFVVSVTGLAEGTTYYVRAYAINSDGTAYGDLVSFRTTPEGAINSLFSVGEDMGPDGIVIRQVYFSQGNLQYQASTNTWKFADNQWDYVGEANNNISPTYDGWIDLFGWGTSGYDHGAVCYQPWSTSTNDSDYSAYGNPYYSLYDQTGQADWGYNSISNGGNIENIWRTLTAPEWNYVFNMRNTSSGIRYAKAQVNGANGIILLPDDWIVDIYYLNNTNTSDSPFEDNILTSSQWVFLEQAGAVFLSAAGLRYDGSLQDVGSQGNYWSATYSNESLVDVLNFGSYSLFPHPGYGYSDERHSGLSVRLVQDTDHPGGEPGDK